MTQHLIQWPSRLGYFSLNVLVSVATSALLFAVYWARRVRWRSRYRFPPSPPGSRPFTGHSHLMPHEFHGDKAKEWGMRQYHFGGYSNTDSWT